MMETISKPVITLSHANQENPAYVFARDVSSGLNATPKRLSSVNFYDERGSQIFEQICDLDEYYLTRKETEILLNSAHDIISTLHQNTHLIELGSGSSTKTRILLEAALARFSKTRYSPIDVSSEMLTESVNDLSRRYPLLQIEAVADLYEPGLENILRSEDSPDCIMWLGSSIGNLSREEATAFLTHVRADLHANDSMLLGIDLRKDANILEPAYNDASGVTAAFNLNLLDRINRELGGHFDISKFHHQAVYNNIEGRIEMYLISDKDQEVRIDALDSSVKFNRNENVLTEYSYKYSHSEIDSLARSAGFRLEKQWLDEAGWFSLNYLIPTD